MKALISYLENHSVEITVRVGRVWAKADYMLDGVYGFDMIDVTGWSIEQAREHLGY